MNELLSDVDWDALLDLCSNDPSGNEFVELVQLTVLQVCLLTSPKKLPELGNKSHKSEHSRNRYVLNRKRRKLSSQLSALKQKNPLSAKIKAIQDQIDLLHFYIKETHVAEQSLQEKIAIGKVLNNPKYFFSYAKRFSKSPSNIGPLLENGDLTNDPLEMANTLQDQYKSVFSDPSSTRKSLPTSPRTQVILDDILFSTSDIEDASDEIDRNSSTTDNDIPSVVLKECKTSLSYPIFLIWRTSFQKEAIPNNLKTQMITPVLKKATSLMQLAIALYPSHPI